MVSLTCGKDHPLCKLLGYKDKHVHRNQTLEYRVPFPSDLVFTMENYFAFTTIHKKKSKGRWRYNFEQSLNIKLGFSPKYTDLKIVQYATIPGQMKCNYLSIYDLIDCGIYGSYELTVSRLGDAIKRFIRVKQLIQLIMDYMVSYSGNHYQAGFIKFSFEPVM